MLAACKTINHPVYICIYIYISVYDERAFARDLLRVAFSKQQLQKPSYELKNETELSLLLLVMAMLPGLFADTREQHPRRL